MTLPPLKGSGKPVSCLGNFGRLEVDSLGLNGSAAMAAKVIQEEVGMFRDLICMWRRGNGFSPVVEKEVESEGGYMFGEICEAGGWARCDKGI